MTKSESLRNDCARAVSGVIVGQEAVLHDLLVALVSEGHALIEGVPGTAKTTLVRSLARALDLEFGRIQFTPDLMPSDIVGTHFYSTRDESFRLVKGPVFTQVLLADEINRAPAKTQSALLESMQERQVTVEGDTLVLPSPFVVFATQNPVEHEGTYPLPLAQLDRFLLKVLMTYPEAEEEVRLLETHQGDDAGLRRLLDDVTPVADAARLAEVKAEVLSVTVRPEVVRYVVEVVRRTRTVPEVNLGASPRSALLLQVAARACAAFEGRDYVIPDDVKRMSVPVLRHRLLLTPSAEVEGLVVDEVVDRVVDGVAVPR